MPIPSDYDLGGIVSPSPIDATPAPVTTIKIAESKYKDVAVDTRWSPIDSIMPHVAGAKWTVEYFAQVIDTDTQLMSQAPTTSGVYQQYKLIKELVLRVTTPLNSVQDTETKMMQMDGAAILSAGIIPNEGDMFTADIGVGTPAVFRVTASKKNSVLKQATYDIEYALASTSSEYTEDLERKVIDTYVFRQDFLTHGREGVILEEDDVVLSALEQKYVTMVAKYFNAFFNPEFATFTIPLMQFPTYDPFLTRFLNEQFSKDDSVVLQKLRVLNLGNDACVKQYNFWDALINRDFSYLNSGFTKVGLVYTNQFIQNPYLNGIRWTGIVQCVYPLNPRIGIGGVGLYDPKTATDGIGLTATPYSFYTEVSSNSSISDYAVNQVYPSELTHAAITGLNANGTATFQSIGVDSHYILSEKFYTQDESMSVLERLISDYIHKKQIDPIQLSKTLDICERWGVLEQFYLIPVLLIMIRGYVNDFQG